MERKINHGLNLLRIISMLGIIGLHVLNIGGGMDRGNLLSPSNVVLSYCYILCVCSVDTFAMMTGYLYEGRTTLRYKNLLNLLVTVFSYSFVLTGCFYFLDRNLLENAGAGNSLNPFLANRYWYIACYTLLFVLIPYINILLNNINDRQFDILVILLLVMTSVLPVSQKLDFFRMDKGYSSAWLIVCYILGAYVKRRQPFLSLRKSVWLIVAVSVATLGYSVCCLKYCRSSEGFLWATEYISPGIVLMSMLLVNIFSGITLAEGKLTKAIAGISAAAFDAYILHAHILIIDNYVADGFLYLQKVQFAWLIPAFVGALVAIYAAGWITYKIRAVVFRITKLNALLDKLGNSIDRKMFV